MMVNRGILIWVAVCLVQALPCVAQDEASPKPEFYPSPGGGAIKGMRSERWSMIAAELRNRSDEEHELVATMSFETRPSVQFATRIWAPPGTRQRVEMPVRWGRPNAVEDDQTKGVVAQTVLLDSQRDMTQISRDSVQFVRSHDKFVTGMMTRSTARDANLLVSATRRASKLSRRINFLRPPTVPDSAFGLHGLDALVLAQNEMNLNPAQTRALRQWVFTGGNLWVMLDKVNLAEIEEILADAWTIQVIDTVGLNRFTIEGARSSHSVEVEDPILLKRVLATDMEVLHRVNGYPASLRRRLGLGKLLVTTLGPRAWLEKHHIMDIQMADAEMVPEMARLLTRRLEAEATIDARPEQAHIFVTTTTSRDQFDAIYRAAAEQDLTVTRHYTLSVRGERDHTPTRPLRELSRWFNQLTPLQTKSGTDPSDEVTATLLAPFQDLLNDQMGYRIIGRGPIAAVLGTFCVLVLFGGLWLAGRSCLEHVGYLGPIGAIVVAAVLMRMGFQESQLTVSNGLLVQLMPEHHQAVTRGVVHVYNPDREKAEDVRVSQGTMMWPDATAEAGRNVRLIREDFDQWQWQDLRFPRHTVRTAGLLGVTEIDPKLRAEASFDEQGMVGHIQVGNDDPLGELQDALLVTHRGVLPLALTELGRRFTTESNGASPPGQYIKAMTHTADQRRRQKLYQDLLGTEEGPSRTKLRTLAREPTLLAWAARWDTGIDLLPNADRKDAILISVPLAFHRPEAGTIVTIPSILLDFGTIQNTGLRRLDLIYSRETGWLGQRSQGGEFQFVFTMPKTLRPLSVQSATLLTNLRATDRTYELFAVQNDKSIPVARGRNPDGHMSIDLKPPPQPDAEGRIVLGLHVSELPPNENLSSWYLNRLELTLQGQIGEAPSPNGVTP